MSTRYDLNALELLLLGQILRIENNKLGKDLKYGDFEDIGEYVDCNIEVIRKIFNHSSSKSNGTTFNRQSIEKIISKIKGVDTSSWEENKKWELFKQSYFSNLGIRNPSARAPKHHLIDHKTRTEIFDFVNAVLYRIYKDDSLLIPNSNNNVPTVSNTSSKLISFFLNTKWYFYYFFANNGNPKLGRLILRIGNQPNKVLLEHFDNPENNSFRGNVHFDLSQSFLIFNLKTIRTNENDLHFKVDANTGNRPDIMLGLFSNIGLNFSSLVCGKLILENITELDDNKVSAIPIGVEDQEFFHTDWAIRKYLRYNEPWITRLKPKIYSKEILQIHIRKQENKRPIKRQAIRQKKKYQIIISCPKFSIQEHDREKYYPAQKMLKEFCTKNDLEVLEEPLTKTAPPLEAKFYYKRIVECDVIIMFFFDKVVSNCLSELAWAYQLGKKIILFSPEKDYIPRAFLYESCYLVN